MGANFLSNNILFDFSSVQVQVLTCDKLSHCLFDFDCVDLNVYENEQYNYDYFEIADLRSMEGDDSELTTHDIVLYRSKKHNVAHRDYTFKPYQPPKRDKKGFEEQIEFMRLLFKPKSQTLWGFHHSLIPLNHMAIYKDDSSQGPPPEMDEENDVDMNNTMWLVLRKTKPTNETLKRFFAEIYNHPIKIKDIVKFGRVNFKVSALSSSKLDNFIQGKYEDVTRNAYPQQNVTQQNLLTQMNDFQRAHSQLSMHTDMNLYENPSMTMIQNVTAVKSPRNDGKKDDEESSQGGQKVCRICLGEFEPSEPENELISPCKCSGSMQHIHINCLREWMNGKKLVYNGNLVRSFFWKALECELCKSPFENQMKGKLFQIMDFERPDDDYLIMESVKSAPAKVIHVFFLDKGSEFKIGRSVDTDMKIADISVSRVHSLIKIKNGQLYIEDNGAKFGTLVKVRDPYEVLQGNNPDRMANLFQVGRSLLYFSLSNSSNNFKRNKKSMRKIECVYSVSAQQPGYLVTKNMKAIPQQFVLKDALPRAMIVNPTLQQFSLSNLQASKPRTQRENESEVVSPKRQRQMAEQEDNKQQMITDDDPEMRRSRIAARRRSSIGEGEPPLAQDFTQQKKYVAKRRDSQNQGNDPDLQSSVNKGFNDSYVRRSLSPRVMKQVNQQNSERRTHVQNSINANKPEKSRHQRKKSQKQAQQILEGFQKFNDHGQPYNMSRFYSSSQGKVVKMGVDNLPSVTELNQQSRYRNLFRKRNEQAKNAEITSNNVQQNSSIEDQEAVEDNNESPIRKIIIQSDEEEEKVVSPRQPIGRTKKQSGNNSSSNQEAYKEYISGENPYDLGINHLKNAINQIKNEDMTRNHTRPEFLNDSRLPNGTNITTQMSYTKVEKLKTRPEKYPTNSRQKDNPTAAGIRQLDEEEAAIEDIISNQGSQRQHRTVIDGRIVKSKDRIKKEYPQLS